MTDPNMNDAAERTQEPEERRPAKLQATVDLNLLPERHRRQWPSPSTVLSWALMLLLLGALYYSYPTFKAASAHYQDQVAALEAAENEVRAPTPFEEQVSALRADIEAEQERAQTLRASRRSLVIQQIAWGATLIEFVNAAPPGLEITSVSQEQISLRFAGIADEYHLPLQYAATLRTLAGDASVRVEAIRVQQPPAETDDAATPTPQPTEEGESTEEEVVEISYSFTITVAYPELESPAEIVASGGGE